MCESKTLNSIMAVNQVENNINKSGNYRNDCTNAYPKHLEDRFEKVPELHHASNHGRMQLKNISASLVTLRRVQKALTYTGISRVSIT